MTPILTFFNNKGGVGKTSLIYHLAWMFADLHKRVMVADLDPQANLTAAFLYDDEIEALWNGSTPGATIYKCVKPLTGVHDIVAPSLMSICDNLCLIPGDVALSSFEDTLSEQWPNSMGDNNLYRPMRILSAFWQVIQMGAESSNADIILVDIGPNLGAINRSALIAANFVVIPLGADLFSLQGLKNLGPALKSWRNNWRKRLENWKDSNDARESTDFKLPAGDMDTIGYVCQQYGVRLERPVKAYDMWVNRVPDVYSNEILGKQAGAHLTPPDDPNCLATIKHYRSLIPLGQEHRKPIFKLTSADGAIGSHANAVQSARQDLQELAIKIAGKMGLSL